MDNVHLTNITDITKIAIHRVKLTNRLNTGKNAGPVQMMGLGRRDTTSPNILRY